MAQNTVKCPKCGSTAVVPVASKKGFRYGRALLGAAFFGPVGLVLGATGRRNVKIQCACMNCGHTWTP
ncbi:MAG: hypothetical protein IKP53_03800 [Candidatus Methanomethylophilaceae archaeon]|nr:hypothetical protein [Candidatus Methanomethylophilaceae archaeon]